MGVDLVEAAGEGGEALFVFEGPTDPLAGLLGLAVLDVGPVEEVVAGSVEALDPVLEAGEQAGPAVGLAQLVEVQSDGIGGYPGDTQFDVGADEVFGGGESPWV